MVTSAYRLIDVCSCTVAMAAMSQDEPIRRTGSTQQEEWEGFHL